MSVIKNTWPKAILKWGPELREIRSGSSTLSALSFSSRGKCSHWYRQAGTQIRCSKSSDRHRFRLEGTTHSSQNVISMQMKGAGIRDRNVVMVTSPAGCHRDWDLISSESSGAWSRWVESQEGRRSDGVLLKKMMFKTCAIRFKEKHQNIYFSEFFCCSSSLAIWKLFKNVELILLLWITLLSWWRKKNITLLTRVFPWATVAVGKFISTYHTVDVMLIFKPNQSKPDQRGSKAITTVEK